MPNFSPFFEKCELQSLQVKSVAAGCGEVAIRARLEQESSRDCEATQRAVLLRDLKVMMQSYNGIRGAKPDC